MFSYIRKIDLGLLLPAVLLSISGLAVISSATPELVYQQIIWVVFGVCVFLFLAAIDIRPLIERRSVVFEIYAAAVILLVATLFLAPAIRGARSWIVLGPVHIQTSELAKVALIILLSYFFAKRHIGIAHVGNIFVALVYFLAPMALVMLQPDLGSALIVAGIFAGYLFVSGLRPRHIAVGIVVAAILGGFAWTSFLKDYQKERILGLFYPDRDPLGINYNVIQSKIAIGSGGFWGKGLHQGTQVQLGFLPESQTDFVFAALVEEWGLFGGIVTIAAFLFLVLRIGLIGISAHNNFSKFFCLGVMMVFLLHFFFNMGSTMALLPVIGVSFPFLSYGGSNLLINFLLVGIIQSIASRSSF